MEKTSKNDPNKLIKIFEKSVLVAIKMETRKRTPKSIQTWSPNRLKIDENDVGSQLEKSVQKCT